MNIAIINMSGNVGKSTLAVHLFAAMKPGAKIISVESINSSDADNIEGVEVSSIEASNFQDIYKQLMMADGDIILDVGASNVTKFMTEMQRFKSVVHELDMIIVPVVPQEKQQRDTVNTLLWLQERKFDPKSIRVIFNAYMAGDGIAFESAYANVLSFLKESNVATYEPRAIINTNEIYDRIKSSTKTIKELAEAKTDWRALRNEARSNGDITGMEEAVDGQINHDLAETAQANIEQVWQIIMGKRK